MTLRQAQGEGARGTGVLRIATRLAAGAAVLGLYGGLCTLIVGSEQAWPHDAQPTAAQPQGLSYPTSCCSGFDCREVADSAIAEGAQGYRIRTTGEIIPMSDVRIKNSPDGKFHWCSVAGAADSRTICLFVQPRGF